MIKSLLSKSEKLVATNEIEIAIDNSQFLFVNNWQSTCNNSLNKFWRKTIYVIVMIFVHFTFDA